MPYSEFDKLPRSRTIIDGGEVDLATVPQETGQRSAAIQDWASQSAQAIATYFGRFPVGRLRLLVVEVPGNEIHGTTWGYRGAATRITLGEDASATDIMQSWVMAHEMVHVALPFLPRQQLWLEEGLATYVGPIARAQAGLVSAEYVWDHFLWGMRQGLPKRGDEGLDHTHTWGRTFWGGALFCLLADIEIRAKTANRLGLQEALRAVVAAGGNGDMVWPLTRFLRTADGTAGVPVLQKLYARMRGTPVNTNLDNLWKRLGISKQDGRVVFNDSAPLAGIRRAITQAPGGHR